MKRDSMTEEELAIERQNLSHQFITDLEEGKLREFMKQKETKKLIEFFRNPEREKLTDKNRAYFRTQLDRIREEFNLIRSKRLADLSMFEYQFDETARSRMIKVEGAETLPARFKKAEKPDTITIKVRNAEELRAAIKDQEEAQARYGKDNCPKLHIRLANEFQKRLKEKHNVTRDNYRDSKLLEPSGGKEAVDRLGIVISWKEGSTIDEIYDDVLASCPGTETVAIGDIGDRDLKVKDPEKVKVTLYVRMTSGLITQQCQIMRELIANRNRRPTILSEGVTLEEVPDPNNTGISRFTLEAIKPFKMKELLDRMERYEEILMAA